MHLIKNGNKYYIVKNNNSNYGIYGNYYTIINGRLLWANPDIYLQSSGEQYIDTGYYLQSNNLKVKTKFTFDFSTYSSEKDILGSLGSNRFSIGTLSRKVFAYSRTGNTTNSLTSNTFNGIQTLDSEIIYDYDNSTKEIKIDGNTISGTNTIPIASTSNLLLLGPNLDRLFIGNIYYCKIYDNNSLVRHFVPVPKGLLIGNFVVPSNGMFDIVNQQFYENQGTGEFEIGGIPEDYINVGDNIVWVNENVYLESSGSKYIDTEVKPTNLTVVEGKTMLTTINKFIYGSRTSKTASNIHDWVVNTATSNFPQFGSDDSSVTFSWNLNQIYKIKNGQDGAYVDGTLIKSYATYTFTSTLNMYLFGLNQNGSLESRSLIGRIYNFQIKENSKLIRYFLPVNTNTVIGNFTVPAPGMWDAVTKTFYPNKGSGTFIYGKDN